MNNFFFADFIRHSVYCVNLNVESIMNKRFIDTNVDWIIFEYSLNWYS